MAGNPRHTVGTSHQRAFFERPSDDQRRLNQRHLTDLRDVQLLLTDDKAAADQPAQQQQQRCPRAHTPHQNPPRKPSDGKIQENPISSGFDASDTLPAPSSGYDR